MQSNELHKRLEVLSEQQAKSNIERIISSYRHTYDIFAELIQNSADAIIDQFGFDNLNNGEITLNVNASDRQIIISDNGCGISENDLSGILVTGESLKRKNNHGKYGFMGFGLTFIAFQTSFLKIESVKDGMKASRTYNNLYKFIYENQPLQPSEEELNGLSALESEEENGTKITINFPLNFPDSSIESNLTSSFNYSLNDSLFSTILRTRTAVGLLDTIFSNKQNFQFNLILNGSDVSVPNTFLTNKEILNFIFPNEHRVYEIENYKNTIIRISENMPETQKEATRQAVFLDQIIHNVQIGQRNAVNANVYISATSRNYLNRYNEENLNFGADNNSFYLTNGIWLSINGLPTGICIDALEHGNYLPYTVIVDVQNSQFSKELDAGRKGITERRAWQISEKVKELLRLNGFIDYRKYILGNNNRIVNPLYDPKQALIDKFNRKSKYSKDSHIIFLPPNEEQEVISLFIKLCLNGFIKGFTEKVLSSSEVYDALYEYQVFDQNEYIYSTLLPFGIDKGVFNLHGSSIRNSNLVIEFKSNLHQIFADIDANLKDLNQIDIIVCWSIDFDKIAESGSIVQPRPINDNIYFGVTHYLIHSQKSNMPIIELKTITDFYFNLV